MKIEVDSIGAHNSIDKDARIINALEIIQDHPEVLNWPGPDAAFRELSGLEKWKDHIPKTFIRDEDIRPGRIDHQLASLLLTARIDKVGYTYDGDWPQRDESAQTQIFTKVVGAKDKQQDGND